MLLNCGAGEALEGLLDNRKVKPVHPEGNQAWIFIGRTDAEALILWPLDAKNWLIGKDPDAGKDWRQEEKGVTEDEMVGWHHRLDGHEFEQAQGDSEGRGSLARCSSWGCRVRHDLATEQQATHTTSKTQNSFLSPENSRTPLCSQPPPLPWQPLLYFLSLYFYLFQNVT